MHSALECLGSAQTNCGKGPEVRASPVGSSQRNLFGGIVWTEASSIARIIAGTLSRIVIPRSCKAADNAKGSCATASGRMSTQAPQMRAVRNCQMEMSNACEAVWAMTSSGPRFERWYLGHQIVEHPKAFDHCPFGCPRRTRRVNNIGKIACLGDARRVPLGGRLLEFVKRLNEDGSSLAKLPELTQPGLTG